MASQLSIFNKTKHSWPLTFLLFASSLSILFKSCWTLIVGIIL